MFLRVLTSSRSPGISSGLTYETNEEVQPGQYVRVPLRNKIVDGIVIEIEKKRNKEVKGVKEIMGILGDTPLLSDAQIKTLLWMSEYYRCSPRQALRAWLPSPSWKTLLPKEVITYALAEDDPHVRGSRQQMVVEALQGGKELTREQLKDEVGATAATIRSLEKKDVITSSTHSFLPNPLPPKDGEVKAPKLTPLQQSAYKSIKEDPRPSLLFGITSSGKTEIYAAMIADCIALGKQAILLVPEILLTEYCIGRFEELLGCKDHITFMHSRLTPAQRRAAWRKVHNGNSQLVIGSRSALFAPIQNLGLVILDEEHEWTYKNEQTPRYHARETAEELCRNSKAKLILGSATPSLESWSRATASRYHLARLPERYHQQPYPTVRIVDLADVNFGSLYPLSPPLLEAIDARLNRNEQSILFLNRRGIATALLCLDCKRRVVSPDSQLPYTVHSRSSGVPYLMDHTTGTMVAMPDQCPHCKSARLFAVGAGTQKLEDLLTRQFPEARILRADRDTLKHPEQMRLLLKTMQEGRGDILLGTQSVVKGLHLPSVTLAAVVLADVGLSLPHFRAGERIFQLLTQLTGRSGREQPGEVIIQTFRPDALEVRMAAKHQTEEYLNQEIKLRVHSGYPPATSIVRLLCRGYNAQQNAKRLAADLESRGMQKLNVSCAPTFFGGGREWQVLIRGADPANILNDIDLQDATVDVDPVECV